MPLDFSALLSAFATAFIQHDRLLKLRFAEGSGIADDALLLAQMTGKEALSSCYRFELECLSLDLHLELKAVLGQAVDIELLLADGESRVVSGLVTSASLLGSDGGFARYTLVVEPALSVLTHRVNSRVFQDLSVPEIVSLVLEEHIAGQPAFAQAFRYRLELDKPYPTRSYCLQYRESDLDFVLRLLAEEGIGFYWDFTPTDEEVGLHTLVGFDDVYALPENSQSTVRFHRSEATEATDTITDWGGQRQLQANAVQLASFDYKPAAGLSGSDSTRIDQGDAGNGFALEAYTPQTLYYGQDGNEMARYAELRQQALDSTAKTFAGSGTVRSLMPGTWFNLTQHPVHDQDNPEERQFLVTALDWSARNNLPGDIKQVASKFLSSSPFQDGETRLDSLSPSGRGLGTAVGSARSDGVPTGVPFTGRGADAPLYTNSFKTVRRGIPLTPAYAENHSKPKSLGVQTATVTGPAEEEIFTDELGRIKVQFHWQRVSDHTETTHSSATFNEQSSCWLRVAYPSAGANWGHQFIPRIGQEVLIDFIEGDIDRPIVTGVIHNGRHNPPSFSQAGSLPNNKTLSGIKSKEYKGNLYNELIFDDSTNETRTKLSSEHAKTQLNQGYLIHPRTEGKGEPRGEGFELRTDAAGSLRAAQGILISADARHQATGKQLDRREALSQLNTAWDLANTLSDTAKHQLANQTETGQDDQLIEGDSTPGKQSRQGHQTHLKQALDNWERGTNTDTGDEKREMGNANNTQPGTQGILLATAPQGMAFTTPNSATISTGSNFDQISQRDTNQTTGRRWLHNVGESISLFVAGNTEKLKTSLKLIAAKGKVQMQAQSDEIEVTSDKKLAITSTTSHVLAKAQEHITLTSGGGYIRLQGGNIEIHCPGTLDIKAASHNLSGPASMSVGVPSFPYSQIEDKDLYSHVFDIGSLLDKDPMLKSATYQVWTKDKNPVLLADGAIDKIGRTLRVYTKEPKEVELFIGENEWIDSPDDQGGVLSNIDTEGMA